MKTPILGIILNLLKSSNASPWQQLQQQAMVNGEPVSGSLYPWMVSLRAVYPDYVFAADNSVDYYHRFCGGSLISINPITILTAAHCVDTFEYDDEQNSITDGEDIVHLYADLGRTKGPHLTNNYDESGDVYTTLTIPDLSGLHIHSSWNTSDVSAGSDIALIILNDSQTLPANYTIAKIAEYKSLTQACCEDDENLTAIGYGLDDDDAEGGEATDTLERITMEYHPSEECLEFVWTFVGNSLPVPSYIERPPNDQVCARGHDEDICQGDSGGPLFRVLGNGEIGIVGISSYVMGSETDKCNSIHPNSMPSFFTSTAHFNRWINELVTGEVYELQEDQIDADTGVNTITTTTKQTTTKKPSMAKRTCPTWYLIFYCFGFLMMV